MAIPSLIQAIQARFRGSNNNAYNASSNPLGLGQGGQRQNFSPRLRDMADLLDWLAGTADTVHQDMLDARAQEEQAQRWANNPEDMPAISNTPFFSALHHAAKAGASAEAAADAVTAATNQAARLAGTSSTSNTPSLASKTFTTQAGKAFDVGSYVHIQSRGTLNRWMGGRVTAYAGTSLTVAVETIGTTTTAGTDWDIRVSGSRGSQGIPGIATLAYEARASNTAFVTADSAHFFDLAGAFTQTFAAAATIGPDWYVVVRNPGPGDNTLDPNGSETIDGLTSFVMYPGEVRLIQCDGTTLRSIVLHGFQKTFTASGSFIKPPGYSLFEGLAWGGGGGGGQGVAASGGGGGACIPFSMLAASFAPSTMMFIGAGGSGASVPNGAGTAGGLTTFGDTVYAFGGGRGVSNANSTAGIGGGGGGGAFSNGSDGPGGRPVVPNTADNPGFGGGSHSAGTPGSSVYGGGAGGSDSAGSGNNMQPGGASLYGGGGGGGNIAGTKSSAGGLSSFGGNGGRGNHAGAGSPGVAPGGGGGGGHSDSGGNGARGEIRIWGVV